MKLFPFGIMIFFFLANYLAISIPFVLHNFEKFASYSTKWYNRKILTNTLGEKANIYLFCYTKINRKKKSIQLTESLPGLFNAFIFSFIFFIFSWVNSVFLVELLRFIFILSQNSCQIPLKSIHIIFIITL